ncbi:MAG TPA: hypothetical protein VEC16_07135 [Alphaproteobacteria bacterium]|nr:hypothetical protein [Alphaproteobacteria bacterium]
MYSYIVKRGVLVVVVFLLAISFVHAFGVSAPYIEDNTLKVNSGKVHSYTITVQNGDEQDYYVQINHSHKEIISMDESLKYVPSKSYNTTFTFLVSIPQEIPAGTEYNIEYTARPVMNQSDAVSIGVEIKRNLKVIVTDAEGNIPVADRKPLINISNKGVFKSILKYAVILASLVIAGFVVYRLWTVSKGISEKINNKKSNYTLRESRNIHQLHDLIKKMSDEEFNLPIVKHIIKDKLTEFNEHHAAHKVIHAERSDMIKDLENIKQFHK